MLLYFSPVFMRLSVIIVNYNVRYFLEQCLCSVKKAIAGMDAEVFVVDNASTDGSEEYLPSKFPWVKFIWNKQNAGFAKANNQALQEATGEFVLFINPDTIVPEDCFEKCIAFLSSHPEAGALGIRMVDGSGKFLKESKRAFPSPSTSFFKLIGLSGLFPRSKVFAKYHLGHLDAMQNHEVDVLAGAFMMVKQSVLKQTGGFDESFFMYGEDIDLSYRVQKAACSATDGRYKNFYFAESSIIHFKGESTRKGSLNYVRMFYTAMNIFVKKHYRGAKAGLFHFFISTAIWIRATFSALGNFLQKISLPLIDALLILLCFWLAKTFWNKFVRPDISYSVGLLTIALPVFTVIYLVAAYYAGLYDKQYRRGRLIRSTMIAGVVVLAVYSLLPEKYRFSRAILLMGSVSAWLLLSVTRRLFNKWNIIEGYEEDENLQTLVAGTAAEYSKVTQLMENSGLQERVMGRVAVSDDGLMAVTALTELNSYLQTVPAKEIIFCEGELSYKKIIEVVQQLPEQVRIRIFSDCSSGIIGSDSRNRSGIAVTHEKTFRLSQPFNRRIKRLIDACSALLLIITFPLHLFFIKNPWRFILNCFNVLAGSKTWIGYSTAKNNLPPLKHGIIGCNGLPITVNKAAEDSIYQLDYWYAVDYSPEKDLFLLWKGYRNLGANRNKEP